MRYPQIKWVERGQSGNDRRECKKIQGTLVVEEHEKKDESLYNARNYFQVSSKWVTLLCTVWHNNKEAGNGSGRASFMNIFSMSHVLSWMYWLTLVAPSQYFSCLGQPGSCSCIILEFVGVCRWVRIGWQCNLKFELLFLGPWWRCYCKHSCGRIRDLIIIGKLVGGGRRSRSTINMARSCSSKLDVLVLLQYTKWTCMVWCMTSINLVIILSFENCSCQQLQFPHDSTRFQLKNLPQVELSLPPSLACPTADWMMWWSSGK